MTQQLTIFQCQQAAAGLLQNSSVRVWWHNTRVSTDGLHAYTCMRVYVYTCVT